MSDVIKTSGGAIAVAESVTKFRRVVTGHDSSGNAIFLEDAICGNSHAIMGVPTFATTELWKTAGIPVENTLPMGDPTAEAFALHPPPQGTVLRIVEFAPDSTWAGNGDEKAEPMMHRTASQDYAYVIKGEIFAVLDKEEKLLRAGDVLIQRGTNHAWANRSLEQCIVLFVLIDATPIENLPPQ
ncbi:cupin domain-containing protein [Cupriavidus necator]